MGNCQAAEAATVIIHLPGNKIQKIYWSVSAHEIMNSNPGHYVALIVTSPTLKTQNGLPLKQLKLLRPDDTLLIGHVYRLVSFEDVLKEFATKKCVKLGKLLKERAIEIKKKESDGLSLNPNQNPNPISNCGTYVQEEEQGLLKKKKEEEQGSSSSRGGGMGRHHGGSGQWKPALQSISEIGT